MSILFFLLGLALGAAAAWFASRSQTRLEMKDSVTDLETRTRVAESRLADALKNAEDQQKMLEQAETRFKETFEALSGEALKSNNRAFLDLASKSLDAVLKGAKGEITEKTGELKNIVAPLEKALGRYEEQVRELEKTRAQAYGSLGNQIESLVKTQQLLEKETGNLVSALRTPHVRGQWGQLTLKRVVELAGMSEHCDFSEQVSVKVEDTRQQPDMIVHLPNGREVVIDSKVSLHAYMDYIESTEEATRKVALAKHAQQIRKHMNDLASKSYWDQFSKAPDFVVMFIPGETFISAAVECDATLLEDGMTDKVMIASPTTLVSLLRAIAYGWRQEQLTKKAQDIASLGKEAHERFLTFLDLFSKTGASLAQAVSNFNKTVGSLEARVLPNLRKFKEYGATGLEELPVVEPVEKMPRQIDYKEKRSAALPLGEE